MSGRDVSGVFNLLSLCFLDTQLEYQFRIHLHLTSSRYTLYGIVGSLVPFAYLFIYPPQGLKYQVVVIVGAVLQLLILLLLFLSRAADISRCFVWVYWLLHTTSGICIALTRNDGFEESIALLCFLVAQSNFCKILRFPTLCVSSCLLFAVSILTPLIDPAVTTSFKLANHCVEAAVVVILLFGNYQLEMESRRCFVSGINNQLKSKNEEVLEKQAFELRDQVFNMTLEKFGVAEKKNLVFTSPVEEAIQILSGLMQKQIEADVSDPVFLQLKHAIELLGHGKDLFKPRLDHQLSKGNLDIDYDTQRWITDLVQSDSHLLQMSRAGSRANSKFGSTFFRRPVAKRRVASSEMMAGEMMVPDPSHSVDEAEQVRDLIASLEEWDWDIFEAVKLTKGKPLFLVTLTLFHRFDLISKFDLDQDVLKSFLTAVESGYLNNSYHNSYHGADVTRTLHYFLCRGELADHMSDIELLAAIVAAAVHDIDHPGLNNNFLVATADEKAVVYNDISVLENHHCAFAFKLLSNPGLNPFVKLPRAKYSEFRRLVIDLVLATDLKQHFAHLGEFNICAGSGKLGVKDSAGRHLLVKMALKCADVSHAAKTHKMHIEWTNRVVQEFYLQGDREREAGLKVSPFMDRRQADVPKAQIGFFDFIARPIFEAFSKALDPDMPCLQLLDENKQHWEWMMMNPEERKVSLSARKVSSGSRQPLSLSPARHAGRSTPMSTVLDCEDPSREGALELPGGSDGCGDTSMIRSSVDPDLNDNVSLRSSCGSEHEDSNGLDR